jgi:hypothetical protein
MSGKGQKQTSVECRLLAQSGLSIVKQKKDDASAPEKLAHKGWSQRCGFDFFFMSLK